MAALLLGLGALLGLETRCVLRSLTNLLLQLRANIEEHVDDVAWEAERIGLNAGSSRISFSKVSEPASRLP